MSRWYFPSWNGDLRLEPDCDDADKTVLMIVKPTLDEVRIVNLIGAECLKEGWIKEWQEFEAPKKGFVRTPKIPSILINAPMEKVGPVVTAIMRPGPATLTAIKFKDGHVETSSGSKAELEAMAATAYRGGPENGDKDKKDALAKKEDKPTAAATVKRPTPCCPQCIPGSIDPAREVLLAFLTPAEHESWAKDRTIVIEGGLSGHRYMLAHRHSKMAQKFGRCCYDLDAQAVVHFHDWSVPPEEEILAAKLILEHREPWLRNEATLFTAASVMRFKNPFGDGSDGVADSCFTQTFGLLASELMGVELEQPNYVAQSFESLAMNIDATLSAPNQPPKD